MRFAELWDQSAPTPAAAPTVTPSDDADHQRRYALAALQREQQALAAALEGGRNHQLNIAAFSLGQLVPHLSEAEIRDTLTPTAQAIGLTDSEIRATISSGIRSGRQTPRIIPASVIDQPNVEEVQACELTGEQRSAVDAFWDERPVLSHIRDFAYARMCAPWAVLGGCLLRAVAAIPPHVVLPPTIGTVGSLNLLVGLVGDSGAGKGASEGAAGEALTWPTIATAPLGSGEGIAHAYARPKTKKEQDSSPEDPDPLKWLNKSVIFSAPEVDQVAAIGARRGSTLMTQLRSAYSGERLGMQYVDVTKRIILPAHKYRFGLSVGIQPNRGGAILSEADGGTPQRFLWLPVTDEHISATPPPDPGPWHWTAPMAIEKAVPGAYRDRAGRFVLPIPEQVTATIRQAHAARARGEGDALDGHALYTRLKVAVALAILDQRLVMDMDDWRLAGVVMAVSDVRRAKVQARISESLTAADDARARRDARRQTITEEAVAEAAVKRVTKVIERALQKASTMPRSVVRKAVASRDRDVFEEALARLVDVGHVKVSATDQGEVVTWVA